MGRVPNIDDAVAAAVALTARALADAAKNIGASKIGEVKFFRPLLYHALLEQLRDSVEEREPRLLFKHWQGQLPSKLGGIDIAVRREPANNGYLAFIELKWGDLPWAILDLFKMVTGRISPGADCCYLIAGEPEKDMDTTRWCR